MNAVPRRFPPSNIQNFEQYCCPVSEVSASAENAPSRWVDCPLVKLPIYYGACLDLQATARDVEVEKHPYVDDFHQLFQQTKLNISKLRKICLNHQIEVLNEMLSKQDEDHDEAEELLGWVMRVKAQVF